LLRHVHALDHHEEDGATLPMPLWMAKFDHCEVSHVPLKKRKRLPFINTYTARDSHFKFFNYI